MAIRGAIGFLLARVSHSSYSNQFVSGVGFLYPFISRSVTDDNEACIMC